MQKIKYFSLGIIFVIFSLRAAAALEFYVSSTGNDSNPGSSSAPFASLTKARDAVRALKNSGSLSPGSITVWFHAGSYNQTTPVVFNSQDSGSSSNPIIYSAWPGEQASITGGLGVQSSWFSLVTSDSPIYGRLDPSARGQVYSLDLRAHGISDFGTLKPRGFGLQNTSALEVFSNSRPMTLARWPNQDAPLTYTVTAPSPTQFTYSDPRPARWTQAQELWLDGFWGSTWADFHIRASGVQVSTKTIGLTNAPAQFGIQGNRAYFAYNLLEEIDEPGEYYIDRAAGLLYFWPPAPLATSAIQVSMLEGTVLHLVGTQFITFRGLVFEISRGPLFEIEGGNNNLIEGCILRNSGQYAAQISGTNNGLDQCGIFDCGDDGVLLLGGDRASLTPGNNYVTNCQIERTGRISLSYHPGINFVGGCGNIAAHNLLGDMPHAAILFSGNNHRIEYNEIRRVCELTSDAGAIYSGRDWGYRGNSIRFNFIHHLQSAQEGNGVHGVYLDDGMSSAVVFGNVFYQLAGAGIFCGGGRDNVMQNNLIADCEIGHYNGDYARSQYTNIPGSSWNVLERLTAVGIQYQKNPWATAFPTLSAIPNSWSAIQGGLWRNPQNCIFAENAGWSNGTWMLETDFSGTGIFSVYASIADNNSTQSPLFDENASLDRSRRASSLLAQTPNFAPIPFASIGPANVSTSPTVPPPALVVSARQPTFSTVELRWSSGGDLALNRETGFSIEQCNQPLSAWSTILSFGANAEFASITGLAPSTTYSFRVKAYNSIGTTTSNLLTLTTGAAPLIPGAVTRVEAESSFTLLNDVGANGSVGASDALLDSGQSIRLFDVGDAIRINFQIATSGTYRIGIRVRSGDASIPVGTDYWPNGYKFKLDGVDFDLKGDTATISNLDPSYGPTYWGTMSSDTVSLSAGTHSVDVTAAMSWAVVDYLEITSLTVSQNTTFSAWQKAHFSTNQIANTAVSGTVAQPAGDGVTNLLKYALDLDPWTAVTGSIAQVENVNGKLQVDYIRPVGLTDLNYAVEVTNDLVQWTAIAQTSLGQSDGTEMMQAIDPALVPHRFARIEVYGPLGAVYSAALPNETPPATPIGSPSVTSTRIEAESTFSIVNDVGSFGAIAGLRGKLDSGGCVSLFDVGDAISIPFSVGANGIYRLAVRVRAGDAGSVSAFWPNGYQYKLDGTDILLQGDPTTISALDPSFGPCYWGTMLGNTPTLAAGKHTLEIISARSWGLVDYIDVSQPNVVRVEAEDNFTIISSVGTNGAVVANDAEFDSGKDVALFDVGDAISISFTVASSGTYRLGVRVRAGDAGSMTAFWPSGYAFKLDGNPTTLSGDASTLSPLDNSYGPTYWGTMYSGSTSLPSGPHTLEVKAVRPWAAVDYLEMSPP